MATRRNKKASPARHAEEEERERLHDDHDGAKIGRRPVWQGHLKLSLVNCPVALFNATSSANDIHFHMINPKTDNRVRMIPTDPDTGPIERADLVKGYEIKKNRYVIVTQDELDAVKLETTHTLDIERFVEATDIDRLFWNDPYYLVPNDKSGIEAYTVIRDALEKTNRIALGRVVMHTRERLMALEPRGKGLIAYSLRMRDEVVDPKKAFGDIPSAKPDHSMIEIAEKIIEQQAGAFEPEKFEDRYEKALRDLLRRKERGEKLVVSEPPERSNVIDLMDALRKSLKKEGRTPPAANRVGHRAKG
jgi:DNA end-binding protein Ku